MRNTLNDKLSTYNPISTTRLNFDGTSIHIKHTDKLYGTIPNSLSKFENLQSLRLNNNNLYGEIPDFLSHFSSLQTLYLQCNQFSGNFPKSILSLSNLQYLNLGANKFCGTIPESLFSLSSLVELKIGGNKFSGELPNSLFSLSNLQYLHINYNNISGEISSNISLLSNLQVLDFGNCNITGVIPDSISCLTNLTQLYFRGNKLSGEIPDSLSCLSHLSYLYLYENELSGNIPSSLSCLTKLRYLNISNNKLFGEIPDSLSYLTQLLQLKLNDNCLSGKIPDYLTLFTNIQLIDLSENDFTFSLEVDSNLQSTLGKKLKLENSYKEHVKLFNSIMLLKIGFIISFFPIIFSFIIKPIINTNNNPSLENMDNKIPIYKDNIDNLSLEENNNYFQGIHYFVIFLIILLFSIILFIITRKYYKLKSGIDNVLTNKQKVNNIQPFHQVDVKELLKEKDDIINNQQEQINKILQENITRITKNQSIIDECKENNTLLQLQLNKKDETIEFLSKKVDLQYNIVSNTYKHLKLRDWIQNNKLKALNFKDISFLGKGCNGLVMKSNISVMNKEYTIALKMIINLAEDETIAHTNRVKNEFVILPKLIQLHPNIVSNLGSFTSKPTNEMINHIDKSIQDLCYRNDGTLKGAQFFILEYYDKTLQSIIKNLSEDKIIKYATHLARGLLYLYECKVVHLDIKTDNLMISSRDELVIVDFGVAGELRNDFTVDYRKTIGGNTYHLSPEVINARGTNLNLPCKYQYSWELGMILYEMLSKGDYPFDTYATQLPVQIPKIRLKNIPNQYHNLLQLLLCDQEHRISIIKAWKYIENLYSKITQNN